MVIGVSSADYPHQLHLIYTTSTIVVKTTPILIHNNVSCDNGSQLC